MKKFLKTLYFALVTVAIFGLPPAVFRNPEARIVYPSPQNGLEFWAMQRAYPDTNIPDQGLSKAFRQKVSNPENTQALNAADTWLSIGPKNFGGRTIALALDPVDPNIVWAGAASGGLWKLHIIGPGDNDYTWQRISTGYPVLGVGAIAVDPRDRNAIYIGTGETYGYRWQDGEAWGSFWMRIRGNYGIGILKTTDGGLTWNKSLDWTQTQQRGVMKLEFDPSDPDTLFAGTTEGVFRSRDAGATWEHVLAVVMTVDLKINPENPGILFASCGNLGTPGHGIYRSWDGGDTWTKLTDGLPESWQGKAKLDIYRSSPDTVYADIANYRERLGLYISEDGGDTWRLLNTLATADYSTGQGYYSHFVRVNPVNNNRIFVAKVEYAYSQNGGINFTIPNADIYDFVTDPTVAHGDCHTFANIPGSPDSFYMSTDGGVHLTTDGGKTFRNLNNNYITTQFYPGFASSPTDPSFAIGGMQDNGTTFYLGTPDWRPWITYGDGGYNAIDGTNENIVYTSSQFLVIYRSTNRFADGDNWLYATPLRANNTGTAPHGDNEYPAFIAPFVLVGHDTLFAATNYLYRSDDGGLNWSPLNDDRALNGLPVVAMAVNKQNPDILYAATAPYIPDNVRAMVYMSRDGGLSWDDITLNLPNRYVVDLITNPNNGNIVYLTLSGFGTSHLFRKTLDGSTWEDIGLGLPDLPTSAVAIDPDDPKNIYIGNDLGVWVSTDYGESWSSFNEGLPEAVIVMDLSVSKSDRKLRAATHGSGVYERSLLPAKSKGIKNIRR